MKIPHAIAIVCLCAISCACQENQPFYLVWPEDMRDAERVAELCRKQCGEMPWLVADRYSQVIEKIPPHIAFLRPDSQSNRVRRGRAFIAGKLFPYAQVAQSNHTFSTELQKPTILDRPFLIHGEFSDQELMGIFTAVRKDSHFDDQYILKIRRKPPKSWYWQDQSSSHNVEGEVGVQTEIGARSSIMILNFTNQEWKVVSVKRGIS